MSATVSTAGELDELAEQVAGRIAGLLDNTAVLAPLLDATQAGQLLNVPPSWLMAQARESRVPHRRFGKYVRFNRDELLAWAEEQRR